MNNTELLQFIEYYAHPLKFGRVDTVGTALHALCVAKSKTWVEAYNELIEASGSLGLMPNDKKTVNN